MSESIMCATSNSLIPVRRLASSYELVETTQVPEGSVAVVILPASSYEYVVEFEFQAVTVVRRFALS